MKLTDPDLLAVQQIPPGCTEPSDEAKSRTWYQLARRHEHADAPNRFRRVLLPAGAAAVVVAIAAGVMTIGGGGGGDVGAPKIDLIKATHQDAPTDGRTTPEAIAALSELAETAERSANTPLPDGSLIYVNTQGWAVSFGPDDVNAGTMRYQPRTSWLNPHGMIYLKNMAGNDDMNDGPYSNHDRTITRLRQMLSEEGPSVRLPTPEWLASLPTDPEQLLAVLRQSVGVHDSSSADQQLWDAMGQLYHDCELILSPQLRAALLRAYTGMDGLTVGEVDIDGWKLVAIRQIEGSLMHEILFDPLSGHAVGRRSIASQEISVKNEHGPRFDPDNVAYHGIWTQAFVAKAGERP